MSVEIVVPYEDRTKVEEMGAIVKKQPYYNVPENLDVEAFKHWKRPKLKTTIEGKDRTFGKNWLYVDLVPSSCWYTNVRNNVDAVDWERIKQMSRVRANNLCELCGARADSGRRNYMECHERFHYDEITKIQKLVRFVCLCTDCHQVTHFGLSQLQGREQKAFSHLMMINKWDEARTTQHIDKRFHQWEQKSAMPWELDLSMLDGLLKTGDT